MAHFGHIELHTRHLSTCHLISWYMASPATFLCSWSIEHTGHWAIRKLNFDLSAVGEMRLLQLNELDEFRLQAYENSKLYKERLKRWHNQKIIERKFEPGQTVLLFNSRLRLFPGKLKSRWSGPFMIKTVFPHGAVELVGKDQEQPFKVNGRLKHY